ncbi:hypothetical protein ACMFMG_009670 [Clarireedia jacksonii]
MSVTITDNPITSTLHSTLQDYEIHVTGDGGDIDQTLNARESPSSGQNPHYWPRDHYRIPNHRPINHNLNLTERPRGSHPIETVFVVVMFTGVSLNAGVAQAWGKTGGKVFPNLFRYAIGGEW